MWFWWGGYKIRHAIISDDLNSIEKLQSKNWPYFIKCLLEVSDGDISSLNLINLSQNRIDTNELKIINDTIEDLEICKSYYSDIHAKCWLCFSRLSTDAPHNLIQKMQDNIRLNLFLNTDLKNEQNPNEILQIFDIFFKKLVDFLQLIN